jgi:hypothetical protein
MDSYRIFFTRRIREYYSHEADAIIREVEGNYAVTSKDTAFAVKSRNPVDRRLDFSAYFLALIITLDKRGESFQKIREICLKVTDAYVRPRNKLHAWAKKTLPRLTHTWLGQKLIRKFHERVSVNENKDGFIANIITDIDETYGLGYGVDIIECGICKLFAKHNYSRYASILCEVDEITSGLAGLQLIRTGTIATGATKCDFRFKRTI